MVAPLLLPRTIRRCGQLLKVFVRILSPPMVSSELERWRSFADGRITPIEDIKGEIRNIREELDRQFPSWQAAYDADPADYPSHDARREYFVTLRVILQNAQLGFIYIRDHLTNEAWWRAQMGEYREPAVLQALREYAIMIKFFSFHGVALSHPFCCHETPT